MLSVRPTTGADKDAAIIDQNWKAAGIQPELYFMSRALAEDREHISTQPFLNLSSNAASLGKMDLLHSRNIASPANRWNGSNNGGYRNPRVDILQDRLDATVAPSERVALIRDLVREVMGEAALVPLYFQTDVIPMLKGVRFHSRAMPFTYDKG